MKKYQNYTIEMMGDKYLLKYKGLKLFAATSESEALDMAHHHITNIRHIACNPLTINDLEGKYEVHV